MKLPLLLLSFLFCFPLFGQVLDSVDWLTDNDFIFKPYKRQISEGDRDDVTFSMERNISNSHRELFSLDYFEPVIDTTYKTSNKIIGGTFIQDTFYIERISKFIDNEGNADIQYFHPNGQLKKEVRHIPFIHTYTASTKRFPSATQDFEKKDTEDKPFETFLAEQYYGVADGIVKYYYPSGQLEKIEEYDTGIRNGKFQSYYRSGQIKEEKEYNYNCPVGNWKFWYVNGQIKSSHKYENCQPVDSTYTWYENGQISYFTTYKNGQLDGEKKIFYEDGSLMAIENYKVFENEKSAEVLSQEILEKIRNREIGFGPGSSSSQNGWKLNNLDTLARVKQMVQLEKYYYMPYGKFTFFNRDGSIADTEHFNEKAQSQFSIQSRILQKKAWKFQKENGIIKDRCTQDIYIRLPFRLEQEETFEVCISNLKIGIPDTSSLELFLPFTKEYQTFTQIITLKSITAEVQYVLKYPSGQTFIDYNFNKEGKHIGEQKVYHSNGKLRRIALFQNLAEKERNRLGRSPFDESKDYTVTGKISIDYSYNRCPENYENCNNSIYQYFYDTKDNLKAVKSYFDKENSKWIETTHFYPNGNIKKKILQKSRKLHNWQELYNQAGELIAKEKFEEGKSVEFIKY